MKFVVLVAKLKRILPKKIFQSFQKSYRKFKWYFLPKFSEDDLKNVLVHKMGLVKGDIVFVHSSIDNLRLDFPFYKILQAILDIIDINQGTVLFPTTQFLQRAEDYLSTNKDKVVFDVKKTPTLRGLLPEFARRHKQAIRSLHPTDSIVGIGKLAKELVSEHHLSVYPHGELSPFYKMTKYSGKIIGLGVSSLSLTFVHCIEDVMKDEFPIKTRCNEIYECKVKDYNSEIITVQTLVASERIGFRNLETYIKKNIPKNILHDFKYKKIDFFVAHSNQLFNEMEKLTKNKITIYTHKAFIMRINS